jgi:hypothetical protein
MPQQVCPGTVTASGVAPELVSVSEVPSRRTIVLTVQDRNPDLVYIRLVLGKVPLNAVALS